MHITGLCPFCRSPYQVQASLRGQAVRCPNAACKQIFTVPADAPPLGDSTATPQPRPNSSPVAGQRSGSVGDLVPILPAEQASATVQSSGGSKHVSEMLPVAPVAPTTGGQPADGDWWQAAPPVRDPSSQPPARAPAAPAPAPVPSPSPWWQSAPPPVRNPQKAAEQTAAPAKPKPTRPASQTQPMPRPPRAASETQSMPGLTPEQAASPRELPPGTWEPPPVRRGAGTEGETPSNEETAGETHRPLVSKRRSWFAIGGLTVLALVVFGVAIIAAVVIVSHSEENLRNQARDFYKSGSFRNAAEKFDILAKKYPNSESAAEYRFMTDWSDLSNVVSDPEADPSAAINRLGPFVKEHEKDILSLDLAHDAGQRLVKLSQRFADVNANPPDEAPLKAGEELEQLARRLAALGSSALSREEKEQIETAIRQVRQAVERARKRREVLAQLHKRKDETWMDAIKRCSALVASRRREVPDLDKDAQPAIDKLYQGHLASVVYQPRADKTAPPPRILQDNAVSLLFDPLLPTAAPGHAPVNDRIVLALVRGILYALKQSTGELKWAMRVGIDTTVLPLRVPASAFSPELFLVVSADTQTISALGVEGNSDPLWEYHVGQPVLGRPIIIGNRAYLADYSGWVHEIELSRGQLIGRWHLGQPLTRGGARESDTSNRIYFPADDSCIYVLDVDPDPKKRRCLTILYDGHPSGSLRSEPVIIPPEGENSFGYLILNQASGLDAMQLQVFELPLQGRDDKPKALDPPARLAGWTWFEPKGDGEKLAILSDAGNLGLFGIRQRNNFDQALFPLLPQGGLDLSPFLPSRKTRSRERGRAQVVHMRGDDLWVLARGQLQQIHLRMDYEAGPQAKPGWQKPLILGSPLHEAQPFEDRNTGRSTFYVVTQALDNQTCLASAVDEDGNILWQRQLGLVFQGEPLVLTPPGGGSPLLVALDQGGGLFTLDPTSPTSKLRSCWHSLAPALAENPLVAPRLLLAADGHSAYEVAAPGDGHELLVRHIGWTGDGRQLQITPHEISLLSKGAGVPLTPAGPPIVHGSQLLIPMTNGGSPPGGASTKGKILRILLDKNDYGTGPDWRDRGASPTAPCHLLALPGDRFLTTDGSRGLTVMEWKPDSDQWRPLPSEEESTVQLDHLVAAPPALVPNANGQQPGVVVADSSGRLQLFLVQPDGALKAGRSWELDGNLTEGPFVQPAVEGGWRIGCVLDRQRLVWIDPAKDKPLWTYSTGGPALIGPPQRIDDMLVIALQSGRYVGLDPKTGKPKDPAGYTLRTSAAPATTPLAFGKGRMLAPLTDGSALLLAVEQLRPRAKK